MVILSKLGGCAAEEGHRERCENEGDHQNGLQGVQVGREGAAYWPLVAMPWGPPMQRRIFRRMLMGALPEKTAKEFAANGDPIPQSN
jgi:hypothetical protein